MQADLLQSGLYTDVRFTDIEVSNLSDHHRVLEDIEEENVPLLLNTCNIIILRG